VPGGYTSWADYNLKHKKTMNTEIFEIILAATPEERSFVATYINQLQNLEECKKYFLRIREPVPGSKKSVPYAYVTWTFGQMPINLNIHLLHFACRLPR
jgi:hypothetical protein